MEEETHFSYRRILNNVCGYSVTQEGIAQFSTSKWLNVGLNFQRQEHGKWWEIQ